MILLQKSGTNSGCQVYQLCKVPVVLYCQKRLQHQTGVGHFKATSVCTMICLVGLSLSLSLSLSHTHLLTLLSFLWCCRCTFFDEDRVETRCCEYNWNKLCSKTLQVSVVHWSTPWEAMETRCTSARTVFRFHRLQWLQEVKREGATTFNWRFELSHSGAQ